MGERHRVVVVEEDKNERNARVQKLEIQAQESDLVSELKILIVDHQEELKGEYLQAVLLP